MDELENELGQPVSEGTEPAPINGDVSQPPAVEAPVSGSAPAAPSFDPNAFKLNYKGQEITPKDRQHLINLAQQGYGYSQSMEILNKEKREIQEMRSKYGKYAELDERFQKDPGLQQRIAQAVAEYQQGGTREGEQVPPQLAKVMQDVESIKQFQQTYEKQKADEAIRREMDELRKTYPDEQWDFDDGNGNLSQKLYKHAIDNNIPSLKSAYRDFMFDKIQANVKADTLKQAELAKAAASKAGKVTGPAGGTAPVKSNGYNSGDSYNDLTEKALSMLKT